MLPSKKIKNSSRKGYFYSFPIYGLHREKVLNIKDTLYVRLSELESSIDDKVLKLDSHKLLDYVDWKYNDLKIKD